MKITIEIDLETYKHFKVLADFRKMTVEEFIADELNKNVRILNSLGFDSFLESLNLPLKLQQKKQDYTR